MSKESPMNHAPQRDADKARRRDMAGETPALDPALAADELALDGSGIVVELERKLNALRAWHADASDKLMQRKRDLDAMAKDVAEQRLAVTQERLEVDTDRDAVADARAGLDDERAALDAFGDAERATCAKRREELDQESERLLRVREELDSERAELVTMRGELDEEWASVGRIRRAEEALVKAWETERQRAGQSKLRLVPEQRQAA